MRIGLQIPDFTWPGGPATLAADLTTIARAAEAAGFDSVSVMDHLFQIHAVGPPEHDMLEAYTTLGYLAAVTERVKLFTVMTAVTYRDPGLLAKAVTTLDVLSGGRAWLGVGAAWNEEESRGLGLFFPPTAERFERLEETLQIVRQMFAGDEKPFEGQHYRLDRPLNVPAPLTRPHPPIMIGGGGERKTLRLVAKYGDACNLFAGPDVGRKLEVLREHCEREGRDYAEIEKTAYYRFDPGADGERVDEVLADLRGLADLGFQNALGQVVDAHTLRPLEVIGERVSPAVADW